MHDRLRSVRLSRTLRNVCLCLSLVFFLEFAILLFNALVRKQPFLPPSLVFLGAGFVCAFLSYHFHCRFRHKE